MAYCLQLTPEQLEHFLPNASKSCGQSSQTYIDTVVLFDICVNDQSFTCIYDIIYYYSIYILLSVICDSVTVSMAYFRRDLQSGPFILQLVFWSTSYTNSCIPKLAGNIMDETITCTLIR